MGSSPIKYDFLQINQECQSLYVKKERMVELLKNGI